MGDLEMLGKGFDELDDKGHLLPPVKADFRMQAVVAAAAVLLGIVFAEVIEQQFPATLAGLGVGNGFGYAGILVIVAFFRELLGSGSLFGFQIMEHIPGYVNNGLMLMPPMALIIVGCIIWVHRSINKDIK
jgi:Na+-transporting NADH:ubiquinone oxidoreductase subunit NqrD